MLAVADAGPLHYLVLVDVIDLLGRLFTTVLVPEIVRDEISRAGAPPSVRYPPELLDALLAQHKECSPGQG